MGALATAVIVFLAIGAASLVGLVLGQRLPAEQLDGQSRDTVRLVAAFLSTLSALVLGLMIAAAKSNYDERSGQLRRIAADVVALDRALGRYGVDARDIRDQLRAALIDELQHRAAADPTEDGSIARPVRDARLLGLPDRIQALAAQSEGQRSARDRAGQLADGIAATRVLMTQDPGGSIPPAFLIVLVSWLAAMFLSFGLFARANATVVAALLSGALSVAGAVFLVLELDQPLAGLLRLSVEPLRHAIEMIGG